MSTALATKSEAIEQVLIQGDLSKLDSQGRLAYYHRVCESLGLNPLTKPFEFLTLNGKTVLYARRDCTEQLRKRDNVSVTIVARETVEGVYVVTARASSPSGRCDESIGAVTIDGLKGEARANAMMKAETKAKRRVTLSICGLGMLDETEVDPIPTATAQPAVEQPRQLPAKAAPAVNDAELQIARDAIAKAENIQSLAAFWQSLEDYPDMQKQLMADKDRRKNELLQNLNQPTN